MSFQPRSWKKIVILMILGVIFLISLAREGVFAPWFTLSFEYYTNKIHTHHHTTSKVHEEVVEKQRGLPLPERILNCSFLKCHGKLCPALIEDLPCFAPKEIPYLELDEVHVSGEIYLDNLPFCYTPFYKKGHLGLKSQLHITAIFPRGGKLDGKVELTAQFEQNLKGIVSCQTFRKLLAQKAAEVVFAELQEFLKKNN